MWKLLAGDKLSVDARPQMLLKATRIQMSGGIPSGTLTRGSHHAPIGLREITAERIVHPLPLPPIGHETCSLQHSEVAGNAILGNCQRVHELTHAKVVSTFQQAYNA